MRVPSLAGLLVVMEIAITRKAGFRACKGWWWHRALATGGWDCFTSP